MSTISPGTESSAKKKSELAANAEETCLGRCISFEKFICRTGTAWGLLKGQSLGVLAVYWLFRHSLYALIILWAISTVSWAGVFIGVFFIFIHFYKGMRFVMESKPEEESASGNGQSTEKLPV